MDGLNIACGAPREDNLGTGNWAGAVYMFSETMLNANDWEQSAIITPSDVTAGDHFGSAIALKARRLFVAAAEARDNVVYVYTESVEGARDWQSYESFISTADPTYASGLGTALAVHNNDIVVTFGWMEKAYIFHESADYANDFNVQSNVEIAGPASTSFGCSAAIDELHVLIGANWENSKVGAVYVYTQSGAGIRDWATSETKLTADDPHVCSDCRFGDFVAINGLRIAVSASSWDEAITQGGAVFVLTESTSGAKDWQNNQVKIMDSGSGYGDWFGKSVAFTATNLIINTQNPLLPDNRYTMGYTESTPFADDWTSNSYVVWQYNSSGLTVCGGGTNNAIAESNGRIVFSCPNSGVNTAIHIGFMECPLGYEGKNCGFNIDDCDTDAVNDCNSQNGASCVDGIAEYTCLCASGFTGLLCSTDINECESSPCLNDGLCMDNSTHPTVFNCDCSTSPNTGPFCQCPAGFTGQACDIDIDDCVIPGQCNLGTCVDDINGFNCICDPGYTGDLCNTEIDECASSPCLLNAPCTDLVNSFSCNCTGTGAKGVTCDLDLDDCVSSPCANGATCNDTGVLSFSCACLPGYEGTICNRDVDDCNSSPCMNGGVCNDTGLFLYECDCTGTGFKNTQCEKDENECKSQPCQNGGSCTDCGTFCYTCECPDGFEGTLCDEDSDDCVSSPCLNDGICIDTGLSRYECVCNGTGYSGLMCQDDADDCLSMPCLDGKTCIDTGHFSYDCIGGESSSSSVINDNTTTGPVTITINITGFTNDTDVGEFIVTLPVILAVEFGGDEEDFNVTVTDDVIYIDYTNPEGWSISIVAATVESTPYIQEAVVDPQVQVKVMETGSVVTVPQPSSEKKTASQEDSTGTVLGIVFGLLGVLILVVVFIVWWRKKKSTPQGMYSMPK